MTATMAGGLAAQLDDLDRRVSVVEQVASSAQVAGDPIPANTEVVDDAIGDSVTLTLAPPGLPTGVTATPGTFFENIFADITWTAPVGSPPTVAEPSSYQVELAERTAGPTYTLVDLAVSLAPNVRFNSLKPNKNYSVRVTAISVVGRMSQPTAWVDFTTGADATLPATPTGLNVFRGADSIIASWNENTEPDVKSGHGLYQVELSADNFATVLQSYRTAATVVVFEGLFTEATYKVRVAAIDSSNNQSAAWATSANTTGGAIITTMIKDDAITTPKIVAGAIITDRLAAGAVTAAKIQAGTITANEIAANSITADKLTTSSLTSADITLAGGSFRAGTPPTTGLIINSQGIRLYSGGVVQVALDVAGTASFSGSVTASSISGGSITGTNITGSSISGGTIDIGGLDSTSFHVDSTGQMWMGAATFASAPFRSDASGNVLMTSMATALSGQRMEIPVGGTRLDFYNSSGTGTRVYAWSSGSGISVTSAGDGAANITAGSDSGPPSTFGYFRSKGILLYPASGTDGLEMTSYPGTFIGRICPHPSFSTSFMYQSNSHYWRTMSGTDLMALSGSQFTMNVPATFNSAVAMNGNLDIAGNALTGAQGGTQRAANLRTRNGSHHVNFDYTAGGQLQFWVDGSSIAYIAFGAQVNSGTKSFVIDHPVDPLRHLVHACLEGPTSDVYYRGKGKLKNGVATVKLPVYFEALTHEEGRTVHLTPLVGRHLATLAASYPKDGKFTVKGSVSNVEFFYEVKAIRKDVPRLNVEPLRTEVDVHGFGPYKFYSDAKPTTRQGALDAVESR